MRSSLPFSLTVTWWVAGLPHTAHLAMVARSSLVMDQPCCLPGVLPAAEVDDGEPPLERRGAEIAEPALELADAAERVAHHARHHAQRVGQRAAVVPRRGHAAHLLRAARGVLLLLALPAGGGAAVLLGMMTAHELERIPFAQFHLRFLQYEKNR